MTSPADLPKICFVTNECIGAFRNGGIGTAVTGLVELLAGHGFEVTVLYTGRYHETKADAVAALYRGIGVSFEQVGDDVSMFGAVARHQRHMPWLVWLHLKDREFDIVHFNDVGGDGALCVAAKAAGLAFHRTLLCVGTHGPTRWALELNNLSPPWPAFSLVNGDEELQFRFADVLWAPSRYIAGWVTQHMAVGASRPLIQQNVLPTLTPFAADPGKFALPNVDSSETLRPREIVFFGRLEERKGISAFVAAIEQIGPTLCAEGLSVTFLGRHSEMRGGDSRQLIEQRSINWQFDWRVIEDFDQLQAISYLKGEGRLAVMPSPHDNLPCTVYECLVHGIPFVASQTGGVPELIDPRDHDAVLCLPQADELGGKLLQVVRSGVRRARLAVGLERNRADWLRFHREWLSALPESRPVVPATAIRVLIDHQGSADRLRETMLSIMERLGERVDRFIVLRRAGAGIPDGSAVMVTIDASSHAAHAMLRDQLHEAGADVLLAIRSGVHLTAKGEEFLAHGMPDGVDALVPVGMILPAALAVLPLGNAPAFRFFEDWSDSGGFLCDAQAVRRWTAFSISQIEGPYAGVLDILALKGAIVPLPVAMFETEHADLLVQRQAPSADRLRRFAAAAPFELALMLGAGHRAFGEHYRHWSHAAKDPRLQGPERGGIASDGRIAAGKPSKKKRKSAAKRLRKAVRRLFRRRESSGQADRSLGELD